MPSKAEYYTRLIDQNRQNQSAWCKTLNEIICREKSDLVSCIENDGIIHSDPKSIANSLNQYLSSVVSKFVQRLKENLSILLSSSSTVITADLNSTFFFTPV